MNLSIDLYSGRTNPAWALPASFSGLVFDLLADLGFVRNLFGASRVTNLGYRGLNIVIPPDLAVRNNIPATFIIPFNDPDLHQQLFREIIALCRLIGFAGAEEMSRIAEVILKLIQGILKRRVVPTPAPGGKSGCDYEMLTFDPAPWNDPNFILTNNCYAYATNKRDKYPSKPQPGLGSGKIFDKITGPDVAAAAKRDGAHDLNDCFADSEKPRMLVALVIWPGEDYHWYRKHPDCWGHKPGSTAARNYDNSNKTISNPETCDRGPYTEFTGYFLIPKSQKVAA
ncbi:MAG: hypothetical protein P4L82_11340 [Ancalomicrobiaceae bacterium]|nr:hypothetical protein [Ancalomicrobiaceae bacterium]